MSQSNLFLIYMLVGFAFAWHTCFMHKEGNLLPKKIANANAEVSAGQRHIVYAAVIIFLSAIWPLLAVATVIDGASFVYDKGKHFVCKRN